MREGAVIGVSGIVAGAIGGSLAKIVSSYVTAIEMPDSCRSPPLRRYRHRRDRRVTDARSTGVTRRCDSSD